MEFGLQPHVPIDVLNVWDAEYNKPVMDRTESGLANCLAVRYADDEDVEATVGCIVHS